MGEPTFGIYIPSYKRAKTCTAHKFLEYGTYIVRASEYEEYVEAMKDYTDHIKVQAVEDSLICGLTEVNQWLIDNAPEDIIAILDDDIHHFYYRMFDTITLDDPEKVTAAEGCTITPADRDKLRTYSIIFKAATPAP